VNGHAWKPKWLEEKSNEFIGFNSPLAPFNDAKVSVTKTKGRGKAKVTQQPSAENNQTLAVELMMEILADRMRLRSRVIGDFQVARHSDEVARAIMLAGGLRTMESIRTKFLGKRIV
jgi:hypothetical protein